MPARGLLKGNAAPSLCIFCASRLLAEQLQPAITFSPRHRRLLNTTRSPYQSASPAAQAFQSNGNAGNTSRGSWDPDSELTVAERAEKERRRQQQAEARLRTDTRGGPSDQSSSRYVRQRETPGEQLPADSMPTFRQRGSQYRFRPNSNAPQGNLEQERAGVQPRQSAPVLEREYRATLLNASNYPRERSAPPPSGNEAAWQHLSRGNSRQIASSFSPASNSEPGVYRPLQPKQSDEAIDQAFADHQRTRRPPIRSTCHRCGQPGHHARDCPQPMKCHRCGQPGHHIRDCPQPPPQRSNWMQRDSATHMVSRDNGRQTFPSVAPGPPHSNASPQVMEKAAPSVDPEFESVLPNVPTADAQTSAEREQDRRARRSMRGFEDADDESDARTFNDRRPRRSGRKVVQARSDEDDAEAYLREQRAARKAARKAAQRAEKEAEKREAAATVSLPQFISVSQLAQTLGVHYEHFVGRLEKLGYDDVFPGKVLNAETSGMIAMEYNYEPVFEENAEKLEEEERDLRPRPEIDDKSLLPTRPPVVTIMGHVDHGKTTILDFLRKSSVAAGEAGGITQHIGAFSVDLSGSGKSITFLDTPGHAAFLAMRQRGANVTDIVVLVVAADDSVKPQTIESIRCAREAGVPILVAINKIDKEDADIQRVKNDLARNGVEIEDFGGDTQVVCVSGKTGKGMEELEEAAVTLSEILDHRAETDGDVEGWLLEATTKKAGRVATVLVKRGTLRPGAVIVAGKTWARVKTLRNEAGQLVPEATPGTPIEVDGWRDQPTAGDQVLQAANEHKASDVVEYRIEKDERARTAQDMEVINEARRLEQERRLKEKAEKEEEETAKKAGSEAPVGNITPTTNSEQESGQLSVPFIVKADVSGSAEAVSAYIPSLTSPLIYPQILQSGVGAVRESDIEFAATAQGHIIAFNLPPDADSKAAAEARGVKILENNIIYRVLDDVKAILEEKLPPLLTQRVLGEAEIGATFDIKLGGRKVMWIAGCRVRNGVIGRGSRARVMRGSEKVYDGTVTSLKNVKKDVQEMRKGTECGMGFDEWEGFQVGDVVQTYEEISEKRKL